jgi:hypothetical protein
MRSIEISVPICPKVYVPPQKVTLLIFRVILGAWFIFYEFAWHNAN